MDDYSIRLIRSEDEFYSSLFEDLRRARGSIRIQMYCVEWGGLAEEFKNILMERARSGVSVDLVYDSVGCLNTPAYYFNEMAEAGVRVVEYHPIDPRRLRGPFSLRRLFRRNHRKLVVIDSRVYYLGGMNIGERFLGWEDIMVRGKGRPAGDLERTFDSVLEKKPARSKPGRGPGPDPGVYVVDCMPRQNNYPIKRLYISAIKRAKKRVWIAQAYFLPRRKIVKALVRAAQRGVDVRVVVPDVSDVLVVDLASWPVIGRLVRRGVKVFRFTGSMLHTKMAIIDDDWMTVGTANLDSMSFYWNMETNLVIHDRKIVDEASGIFGDYQLRSRAVPVDEVENMPLPRRAIGRMLYYYSWIL